MRNHPDFLNADDNQKENEFFQEVEDQMSSNDLAEGLIGTIKLPKDLRKLDMELPEPNYIKSYPENMKALNAKLPFLVKQIKTEADMDYGQDEKTLPHLQVMNKKIQDRARMGIKREPSYKYNYGNSNRNKVSQSLDNRRPIRAQGRNPNPVAVKHDRRGREVSRQPRIEESPEKQVRRSYKRELPHYQSANDIAQGGLPKIEVRGKKGRKGRKGKKGNRGSRRDFSYKRPDWWG